MENIQESFTEQDLGNNTILVSRGKIDLEEISTLNRTPNFGGGFGRVYRVGKNRELALKEFNHLEEITNLFELLKMNLTYQQILKNIELGREDFSKSPFAGLRAYAYKDKTCPVISWYLMDFIEGKDIRHILSCGFSISDEDKKRVLLTYAGFLEFLHGQDKLAVDNNWGSVILNKDEVRICDYDFISPIKDTTKRRYCHFGYWSRENCTKEPLTKTSDLEQFALMIDHFFNRNLFLNTKEQGEIILEAEKNKRKYSRQRASNIPISLRKVVSGLLIYPRDKDITAGDFVSAINEDYKI